MSNEELSVDDMTKLEMLFDTVLQNDHPKRVGGMDDFVYEDEDEEGVAVEELRGQLEGLEIVSRAKVTNDRVYSASYHPERTKDLIFFGGARGLSCCYSGRTTDELIEQRFGVVLAFDSTTVRIRR